MVRNHYGYGLRNDEKPFAFKIPQGGNWKSLSIEDQKAFMKGAFNSGGGKTGFLRRASWDEPASTIDGSPMAKATCQLHPGGLNRREYKVFDVTPQLPNNGLSVVELFAGGGLMAVGLKQAGFNLVWANDFDKHAVRAYRENLGDHIILGDITKMQINAIPDVDIISGGPPCQDYSSAGKGEGERGSRGKLVWSYLNIIKIKKPKAFIFENVKGLISRKHRPTFDRLLEKFKEIGYNVSWKLINAWDYGVAQERERVIIVGIRKDLEFTYRFPEPSPDDYRTKVLYDVLGDLPELNIPEHRRFTVRECMRIQSVPDWYVIPEDIPLTAQYRIIGNGVACRVSWYLGKALAKQLQEVLFLNYI